MPLHRYPSGPDVPLPVPVPGHPTRNADDIGGQTALELRTRGNLAQAAHLIRPGMCGIHERIPSTASAFTMGAGENEGNKRIMASHSQTHTHTLAHAHTILLTNDLQNILLSCRHMHGAQVSP